ncbi:hypothetical protein HG531_002438 [Fusarium graminearum]|nr:hypothetical protein HG531_002438 [Fusarium graminearum]
MPVQPQLLSKSLVPPFFPVKDFSAESRFLSCKDHGVASQYLIESASNELILRTRSLPAMILDTITRHDKLACKTQVSSTMTKVFNTGVNTNKDTVDAFWNILISSSDSPSAILFVCKKVSPVMERLTFFWGTIAPDVISAKGLALELEGFSNSGDHAIGDAVNGSSVILPS